MANKTPSTHTKFQRVCALVTLILIALLYLATIVCLFIKSEQANTFLRISVGCTIVLPFVAWGLIWFSGILLKRHTIADLDLMGIPSDHSDKYFNASDSETSDSETSDSGASDSETSDFETSDFETSESETSDSETSQK